MEVGKCIKTYIIQNGLHKSDRDLGLLNEIVLCVLDFKPCLFLTSWGGRFMAGVVEKVAIRGER
jgi:hypothetical protein